MESVISIITSTSSIIIAYIAARAAITLYNHKQNHDKKHEVYETIFSNIGALNRSALRAYTTCQDALKYDTKIDMTSLHAELSTSRQELITQRHLVYLYLCPAFIKKFEEFEGVIDDIKAQSEIVIEDFMEGGYSNDSHLELIKQDAYKMFNATESLLKNTQNVIRRDLKRK